MVSRWLVALCLLSWSCGASDSADRAQRTRGAGAGMLDGAALEADTASPAPVAVPADAPVVAFLGDSIGAGLHLAEHQAFPAVLARRMAEEGLAFRLVNASESGRTTAGALTALDWVFRSEPDVVVLEIGGNDGLRGIDLETVEANLRSLIETSRERGARVLLLGVRMPPNYGSYAASFDALYPRLASEYGLAFVPYFMEGVGGVPEQNLPDGLHPTPQGHEHLADTVEETLRSLLLQLRSS